ncbi:cytidylyltransferase [Flavobacteria bacterium BBFL7]|nr:cytidylyltransferase [Flavobacteria bacterium BBFL7]
MNILITLCARGGSKGIPDKNIKLMVGRPLIYYSLKTAHNFAYKHKADIILSTDSDRIKNKVVSLGLDSIDVSYSRPDFLATDNAGKIDVIVDVKNYAERTQNKLYDYVIDLDVTSPLRTLEDLEQALLLLKNSNAHNIFSVNVAERNPYFNMVEKNQDGYYGLSKQANYSTRQSAPHVYDMNASFYIYSKSFFDNKCKSAITDQSLIFEMNHICFDLDHPKDFDYMEYLLSNNKLDFKLD